MTSRLVKITLVVLAGCTNIDIVRDTDAGLGCYQIEKEIDWVGWDGFTASLDDPFVVIFNLGYVREAVEERKAHLRKIAQEKGCTFVDIVPAT